MTLGDFLWFCNAKRNQSSTDPELSFPKARMSSSPSGGQPGSYRRQTLFWVELVIKSLEDHRAN